MSDRPDLRDSEQLMAVARDVETSAIDPGDIMLTGRKALVTAGGGGIGQGIALGLAKFGADVAVIDVEPARCEATQAAIERYGRNGVGLAVDVMDSAALTDGVNEAAERLGGLDILVNNAGGVRAGLFITQPEPSIRRHLEINLVSTLIATQAAARIMIDAGKGGSIVNVSSIEGQRAAPMFAVYSAAKAGMLNFTRTMAVELADHDIRVNAIAPDHTISPGGRDNRTGPVQPETWTDSDAEHWARLVPLGREGVVEECASTTVWLCSAMSEYVTGITVNVDGGTWAAGGWLKNPGEGWTLNPRPASPDNPIT